MSVLSTLTKRSGGVSSEPLYANAGRIFGFKSKVLFLFQAQTSCDTVGVLFNKVECLTNVLEARGQRNRWLNSRSEGLGFDS